MTCLVPWADMQKTVLICKSTTSIAGGVQTWLKQICAGLDRRHWRPVVALLRGGVANDAAAYRAAYPELETVEIDGRGLGSAARVRAVERCIQRVRPDVFVPLTAVDAHYAACAAKQSGVLPRYLLTIRGNVSAQIADAASSFAFADRAVCPGQLTCNLLEWSGLPAELIEHVPNGASPPVTMPVPRKNGEPLRIGYVGRLTRGDKRVMDLVPLSQQLRAAKIPHQLMIVGEGPAGADLQSALGEHAVFRGRMKAAEIYREIYPQLDALLLFSASEAFGIAAIEAMLHGVVPVSSRYLGHASEGFLQDQRTALLFDVGDAECAARHVARLAEDAALVARLSSAARVAANHYSWSACVEGWASALERCIEGPRRCGTAAEVYRPQSKGRLDRFGVPPAAVDAIRALRFRVRPPPGMRGGEEWPWISRRHSAQQLDAIEQAAVRLDRSPL